MNRKLAMEELGRMNREEFGLTNKIPVIIILDNIRSGLNVGSIFRTADAFRIEKIYCCGYTPAPPHREVLKSALGATETVKWESVESTTSLLVKLKQDGWNCFSIEQVENSISLEEFSPGNQPTALVFGNEVHGVSQEVIDVCQGSIEISQHGTKHSLNVAVCAGILMYDVFRKISATN